MSNFAINFTLPWLLLLLIPALVITLWPYFRLSKKYRRTRNRIISMVLHMSIMVMCVSVLAGVTFSYDVPNKDNEIMLVVDASFSNEESRAEKDKFIQDVLNECGERFKVGIVKFGYNQVYAAELTNDTDRVFGQYLRSDDVDDSATDIAAALNFAKSKFQNPATAKIILISDGVETDGDAILAAKMVATEGIRVDTVSFPNNVPGANDRNHEIQILGVALPGYNLMAGIPFSVKLTVQSSVTTTATIKISDEDSEEENIKVYPNADNPDNIILKPGIQEITLQYSFAIPGAHKLYFEISAQGYDTVMQNNTYRSYIYLHIYSNILLLERFEGEATALCQMLRSYSLLANADLSTPVEERIRVVNIYEHPELVPNSVDALRENDQIILVNVSNADLICQEPGHEMPVIRNSEGGIIMTFPQMLNEYVKKHGGGLLAVGGSDPYKTDEFGNPVAHAFNRSDMSKAEAKAYADMLPVEAVDYTPPLGVVFVIDRSGSMETLAPSGETYMKLAKDAAISSLTALTYRDFVGVITLEEAYTVAVDMISTQNRAQIEATIDSIEVGGGTIYTNALERAGQLLTSRRDIDKKHIVLITDGEPNDHLESQYPEGETDPEAFGPVIKKYYESQGVTLSIVHIGESESNLMQTIVSEEYGHGSYIQYNPKATGSASLVTKLREELGKYVKVDELYQEDYIPRVVSHDASIMQGITPELEAQMPQLGLFFGTKARNNDDTVLMAPYVPLYSQWKYGKGRVGAFMASLKGDDYSAQFMGLDPNSPNNVGKMIIQNIVMSLMPITDIRPQDMTAILTEKNYSNRLDVFTTLEEGEAIEVKIMSPSDAGNPDATGTIIDTNEIGGMGKRATFYITEPGLHIITVTKKDKDNNIVGKQYEIRKVFSYSTEYNVFVDSAKADRFLANVAVGGRGSVLAQPQEVFLGFETAIHKVYDPRVLFIILSIIFFLLDIAVRRFKFKWLHEIVRDYKEKRALKNNANKT